MGSILSQPMIIAPLFGIAVAILLFNMADRIFGFLHKRTFGKREEILKLLKLMGAEVDPKKVTMAMLAMSYGLGLLFFFALWPNIIAGLLFGTVITAVGWMLPYMIVKALYEQRCTAFTDQMVDAMTIMANGIKSGSNAIQSMERVVEIMGNPISAEFKQVITQNQFGQSFEEALLDLGNRIPRPDVQMFVTSINILKETGGNLAETFETIVLVVRERQKVEKKIQAMTAQGMMQGMIVSMVPFVLMGVFYLFDPQFIAPMFNTTMGLILLLVMLSLIVIGGVMIKKIVTIKV